MKRNTVSVPKTHFKNLNNYFEIVNLTVHVS